MAELDPTSHAIGAIQATLEQHGAAHAVIIAGQNQTNELLARLGAKVDSAHTRLDNAVPALDAALDYAENKKKVGWLASAAIAVCGLFGFSFTQVMETVHAVMNSGTGNAP